MMVLVTKAVRKWTCRRLGHDERPGWIDQPVYFCMRCKRVRKP